MSSNTSIVADNANYGSSLRPMIGDDTEIKSAAIIDPQILEQEEEEEEPMGRGDKEAAVPLISDSSDAQVWVAYDAVLSKAGISFKLFLVVLCSGIGLLSDTLEIMSISFAKNDISKHLGLSRQEESTLAGVLFAGMLVGGLFWGRAADIYGRRRVLLISLSLNGTCAAASAITDTFWAFLLARFFSGIGVGGSLPIIFSYVSEWVPRRLKGGAISVVATCWVVGSILAAGLAWAILPYNIGANGFWAAWRIYLLVCSLPSFIAVFLYGFLAESPAFLIQKGRHLAAISALRSLSSNSNNLDQELGHLKRLLEDKIQPTSSQTFTCWSIVKEFVWGVVELFSPELWLTTVILICVILPVHFGYYGFMLWFPEYIRNTAHSGTVVPPDEVYKDSLYVSLASLPGNIISVFLTDVVGPKPILCVSQILSAGSVFLLWQFNSPEQTIILTCVFNAVTAPIFNMVDFLIPALYPASSRGTAFGFHCSLIRVIMIAATWMFSLFIDSSPTFPILITAFLMLSSALVSLFVPNVRAVGH